MGELIEDAPVNSSKLTTAMIMFGVRLEKRRKQLGLSQTDLSVKTGVSKRSISRYESGGILPSTYTLVLFCMALDVTANWLLGMDEK